MITFTPTLYQDSVRYYLGVGFLNIELFTDFLDRKVLAKIIDEFIQNKGNNLCLIHLININGSITPFKINLYKKNGGDRCRILLYDSIEKINWEIESVDLKYLKKFLIGI